MWVKPAPLVQQSTKAATIVAVLLNGVFVVDTGDQALVSDEQQGQARCFVNSAALCFNDAVFDLVAHTQTVTPANAIGLHDQVHQIVILLTIQGYRAPLFKAHCHLFTLDLYIVTPEGDTHDWINDLHAAAEQFQVFGLVRGTKHVGVSGVGFFGRHLVAKARLGHEGGHFCTATQLINEKLIEPRLVDFEGWVGQQTIAVKTLNVVALEGAAITPNIDIILLHCGYQHRAGDGTT